MWGFFEATVFFLVPDVYLTAVVLKARYKDARAAFFYCLAGALLGGLLVYFFACRYPSETWRGLDRVPGISVDLIQNVRWRVSGEGPLSMMGGMVQGIPYKLFAAAWGERGGGLALFLLASFLARGFRFLVSMLIAAGLNCAGAKFIGNWNSGRWILYGIFWIPFYIFYFSHYKF